MDLAEKSSSVEILRLCDRYLNQFDDVNIATALHRLAKCQGGGSMDDRAELDAAASVEARCRDAWFRAKKTSRTTSITAWRSSHAASSGGTLWSATRSQVLPGITESMPQESSSSARPLVSPRHSRAPPMFCTSCAVRLKTRGPGSQDCANAVRHTTRRQSSDAPLVRSLALRVCRTISALLPQNVSNDTWFSRALIFWRCFSLGALYSGCLLTCLAASPQDAANALQEFFAPGSWSRRVSGWATSSSAVCACGFGAQGSANAARGCVTAVSSGAVLVASSVSSASRIM